MQAFYFGPPGRRLFGAFHPPHASAVLRAPVLLCAPFGQESIRAHRMLRVLADRLARKGRPVLRFDPFGTGDSAGADEELDLQGWADDVVAASAELQRRCPGPAPLWMGLRLGATVALLASQKTADLLTPPRALLMFEPVLDGRTYLRSLAVGTVHALEAACSLKDPKWRMQLARDPGPLEDEGVGFAVGLAMRQQLLHLTADALNPPSGLSMALLVPTAGDNDPDLSTGDALSALLTRWRRQGLDVRADQADYSFDWMAEAALNTALVPQDVLLHLVRWSEEMG